MIDMDEKRVTSVLRFSPHYYNTEEELETAALVFDGGIGSLKWGPPNRGRPLESVGPISLLGAATRRATDPSALVFQ